MRTLFIATVTFVLSAGCATPDERDPAGVKITGEAGLRYTEDECTLSDGTGDRYLLECSHQTSVGPIGFLLQAPRTQGVFTQIHPDENMVTFENPEAGMNVRASSSTITVEPAPGRWQGSFSADDDDSHIDGTFFVWLDE
jgi:hypothetical protein